MSDPKRPPPPPKPKRPSVDGHTQRALQQQQPPTSNPPKPSKTTAAPVLRPSPLLDPAPALRPSPLLEPTPAPAPAPPPPSLPRRAPSTRFVPPAPPPVRELSSYAPAQPGSPLKRFDPKDPALEGTKEKTVLEKSVSTRRLSNTEGGPIDTLYHNNHMSEVWLSVAIALHIAQFTVLFTMGYRLMNDLEFGCNLFFVILVLILLLLGRYLTIKTRTGSVWMSGGISTVAEETDQISDAVIYIMGLAALCEGVSFSIYPAATSGYNQQELNESGYYSSSTIIQTLSFATITFYAFHRILRPANRLDPLRTVLEVSRVYSVPYRLQMLIWYYHFSYCIFILFYSSWKQSAFAGMPLMDRVYLSYTRIRVYQSIWLNLLKH
jgi:hypothetical protein